MPKRKASDLATKYKVIQEILKGSTHTQVADKYQLNRRTVSLWWSDRDSLRKAFEGGTITPQAKKRRTGTHADVEEALVSWMTHARQRDVRITGTVLKSRAKDFAEELGFHSFLASEGWLSRFRVRHQIQYRNISGEAHDVNKVCSPSIRGDLCMIQYVLTVIFHKI